MLQRVFNALRSLWLCLLLFFIACRSLSRSIFLLVTHRTKPGWHDHLVGCHGDGLAGWVTVVLVGLLPSSSSLLEVLIKCHNTKVSEREISKYTYYWTCTLTVQSVHMFIVSSDFNLKATKVHWCLEPAFNRMYVFICICLFQTLASGSCPGNALHSAPGNHKNSLKCRLTKWPLFYATIQAAFVLCSL